MVHDYSVHQCVSEKKLRLDTFTQARGEENVFFTDLPISLQQHTLTVMHEPHPILLERDIV